MQMLPSHSPTPITGLAEALGHKARQSPLLLPPWHQDPLCHQAMQSTTPKPTSTTSQQLPSIPQTARLVTISRIAVQQQQRRQRQCRSSASPICLAQTSSQFNPAINVMSIPDGPQFPPEVRNAVILTLDDSGNVHSIYRKDSAAVTGAYWDALTMLPALTPPGPVAILGLGAGTIAHLVHHLYPERQMHGWELDAAVVAVAQEHMGMQALQDAGCLVVHVGDALAEDAAVEGGAAGIIVDLFANGQLIPQLTQPSAWGSIRQRLQPGGRVMCNLGCPPGVAGANPAHVGRTLAALDAMAEAFEGQLACSADTSAAAANMLVLSGPLPSANEWAQVPRELQQHTTGSRFFGWQPYSKYKEGLSKAFFQW